MRKLDNFARPIRDDIGYLKQGAAAAELLFTLIAERSERRPVMITGNLTFSAWERIFKEPLATAAASDRLVHHAVTLEFNPPSYRTPPARSFRQLPHTAGKRRINSRRRLEPKQTAHRREKR